jgi:hypothetical protein
MISSDNTKVHKDWKIVKKVEIEEELERELEDILGKQLFKTNEIKKNNYPAERKTIFRKSKGKQN